MQISNRLAGFSLSQADMLRRAMGKKDAAEMAKQKIKFMEGAAENKHPKDVAGNIFDLMAKFAEYGFNKSHSAASRCLRTIPPNLKTHHPIESWPRCSPAKPRSPKTSSSTSPSAAR